MESRSGQALIALSIGLALGLLFVINSHLREIENLLKQANQ